MAEEFPDDKVEEGSDNIPEKQRVSDPENELSKILTGIDMQENPVELTRKMYEDRGEVFEKYGIKKIEDPSVYTEYDSYYTYILHFIRSKEIEVNFLSKEDFNNSDLPAGLTAFTTKEKSIYVIDDFEGYTAEQKRNLFATSLLHETIHILQRDLEGKMPPEEKEYEAYLAADLGDYFFLAGAILPKETPEEERKLQIHKLANKSIMQGILMSSLISYKNKGIKAEDIPFLYK